MANLLIKANSGQSKQDARNSISNGDKTTAGRFLRNVAKTLTEGANCELQLLNDDGAAASGTVTFSGTGAANDTILVNGVTFTAVASGASGNQWNVGGSATASAAALAAAISASSTALVSDHVSANSAAGVATITAKNLGTSGNTITIAEGVDGGNAMVVSGARLTGGTNETSTSISFKNW